MNSHKHLNDRSLCSHISLGGYSYLRLPIGFAGSPDTFQVKMSEQIVAMKFVYAYIDDVLFIMRVSMDNDSQKMVRNQQSDNVSIPKIIMVFHFEVNGESMNENFTLSKAFLYHLWKIEHPLKILEEVRTFHEV
jgi:hypothetical protein